MLRYTAFLFSILLAGAAFGQTQPSGFPLATLPLNGQDAVLLDQGAGCATHVQPCATKQAPSLRVGQPLVQASAPSSPFAYQTWWDTSTNPAQYKVFNGSSWVPVYQADTITGVPSFPGNVYLPSGNLGIGTTTVAPNWAITLFRNNSAGMADGVAVNGYENASGNAGSSYRGFAARGTLASPTAIQSGDLLTQFAGSGYWSGKTNSYFVPGDSRAVVQMRAAENWSSAANNGTLMSFFTTPVGSSTMAEVARFDPSGNFGLGTTTPYSGMVLSQNNVSSTLPVGHTVNAYENGSGLVGSGYRMFSARGTTASPTAVVTNDQLGQIAATGFWTGKANPVFGVGDIRASVTFSAGENWSGSANNGSYITFATTTNGSSTVTERMRLQGSGGLSIGTSTDPGLNSVIVAGHLSVGLSTAATLASGEIGIGKIAASGTAPGAASGKLALVAGTGAGTCKLILYAGTSATPVTIVDNAGSGC